MQDEPEENIVIRDLPKDHVLRRPVPTIALGSRSDCHLENPLPIIKKVIVPIVKKKRNHLESTLLFGKSVIIEFWGSDRMLFQEATGLCEVLRAHALRSLLSYTL